MNVFFALKGSKLLLLLSIFIVCTRSADLRGLMNAFGCSFSDMPAHMHFLMDADQTVHLRSLIYAINVRISISKLSIFMCTL